MVLKINSKAPDFRLQDSENAEFRLYDQLGANGLVLIFYPKAFSPGCTREVCSFSSDFAFFQDKGIKLVGISHDSEETLRRFRHRYQIPFTMLSDPGRVVCRMYGAVYPFDLLTKRLTFFIDSEKTIRYVCDNLFNPNIHLSEVRANILLNADLKTKPVML